MKTENIGINAGIVWRTLHSNERELNIEGIVNATQLGALQVAAAIGWLARENKIIMRETDNGILYTVFKECYY